MAGPMVLTYRDEDVLVNLNGGGQPLRKNVHDVIIAIGTVIEFDAKGVLPFLRFENMIRVRVVKNEAREIEFAHTTQFRPRLEGHIGIVGNAAIRFSKFSLYLFFSTAYKSDVMTRSDPNCSVLCKELSRFYHSGPEFPSANPFWPGNCADGQHRLQP